MSQYFVNIGPYQSKSAGSDYKVNIGPYQGELPAGSPPNITSQSGDKVALNGTEVTLFVVATGSPTPTYQWYRNSVLISGATSSTYVFFPTFSDVGSYTCTATNAAGSDISDPIEVAVVSNSYRYNAFLLPLDPDRS